MCVCVCGGGGGGGGRRVKNVVHKWLRCVRIHALHVP